jgi:hypothetical protein
MTDAAAFAAVVVAADAKGNANTKRNKEKSPF